MSGVATAIGTSAVVGAYASDQAGKRAGDASRQGAQISAQAMGEALDYLKEQDKLPTQMREGALGTLAGLYGLEGGTGDQEQFIQSSMNSPLYKALMGGAGAGNEAIMQNASMTGGFRSGDVNTNLYDYNTRLSNTSLLSAYNDRLRGIEGLANLPSNANNIADTMIGIGNVQGQGATAGAQAENIGRTNAINSITGGIQGIAGLYQPTVGATPGGGVPYDAMNYGGEGGGIPTDQWLASDIRLKENIQYVGKKNGLNWYEWTWNKLAEEFGLSGESQGVMAHEIAVIQPSAVGFIDQSLVVNYTALGVV